MKDTGPQTAAEAFATVHFRNVMPELLRFARACVRSFGWIERESSLPAAMQAEELLNTTVELLLSGKRAWVPGTGKTEKSLIAFVCMTMKGVASNHYRSAALARRDSGLTAVRAIERVPARHTGVEAEMAARETVRDIRAVINDDAELVAYVAVLESGVTKRDDIAKALRRDPDKVSVLRKRTHRLLEASGIGPPNVSEPTAPEDTGERYDEEEDQEDES